jgi:pimeloyl-ACP methyl ester carboxylesterase
MPADHMQRERAMIRLLALLVLLPLAVQAQERIDIPSRPGITVPVYVTPAAKPVGTAVLFPGGSGQVSAIRNNFLLRVAPSFVAQGLTVAVVDVPSDRSNGLDWSFRAGADHAKDIAAVVAMLKSRSPLPVWLIGTSNGSVSAGNGAASLGPPSVAGVILTSSVWVRGMPHVAAERIRVPVLIVHNRDDGCVASPFGQTEAFKARLTVAQSVTFIPVSGGTSRGDPCQAMSPHGYLGIEDRVVPQMIGWIKAH